MVPNNDELVVPYQLDELVVDSVFDATDEGYENYLLVSRSTGFVIESRELANGDLESREVYRG